MSRRVILPKFVKRPIPILLLAFILIVGSTWAIWGREDKPVPAPPSDSKDSTYVNLNPPTESEKKQTEEHKRSLAEDQNTPPTPTTDKKQVTPVITSADKNNVRAYVPGIVEEDGTCSATLTKGGQVISRSSQGFADVSKTVCAPSLSDVNLSQGSWSVVLSYNSPKSEGKSQPYSMEIQ